MPPVASSVRRAQPSRGWRPWAALLLALLVAACVRDRALPLSSEDDIARTLASPDRAALVRAAAELQHPRLAPVAIDFSRPLGLAAIGALAVVGSPELKVVRAQSGVAQAQVFEAGLLPDPSVSVGFDHPLAPRGYVNAYSAGLALDLSAFWLRGADVTAAQRNADQVRLDLAWQEWQVAGQAQLLAIDVVALGRQVSLAEQGRRLAAGALSRAQGAALRGDLRAPELQARSIVDADAAVRLRDARQALSSARLQLNALLGLPPDAALDLDCPEEDDPPPDAEPSRLFSMALRERLDLQALAAGYASAELSVHRAVLGQYPRLVLTLTRARDTTPVHTFGPSVSLDLPLWNRNRGAIRVAQASREALHADYEARLLATRTEIEGLVESRRAAAADRSAEAAGIAEVLPISARLSAAAARGEVTQTAADDEAALLVDRQIAFLGTTQALAEQGVALQLATGGPLGEGR